jgi:hypothetical protein
VASGAHKLCKTGINIPKNILSTREYEGNMLFMRVRRLGYKHQGVDAPGGMCTGGWGHSVGIMGMVHAWIAFHLRDRTCYVLFNCSCFRNVSVVCGLLWGLVRSPKFWLLCIADLDGLIAYEGFVYHGCADDTQGYGCCEISHEGIAHLSNQFTACMDILLYSASA